MSSVKFVKTTNLKNPNYWVATDDKLDSVMEDDSGLPPTFLSMDDIETPTLFGANTSTMDYANAQGSCLQVDGYKPKVLNPRVGEDYLTPNLIPYKPIPPKLDLQLRGLRGFLKT
jgi:hypothetical protein